MAAAAPAVPPVPHSEAIPLIYGITCLCLAAGRVPYLKLDRTGIALLGAIAIMVFGGVPAASVIGFVNWPTILLLFGFFVLSAQLRLSGFFDVVAGRVAAQLASPARFLILLMLASAGFSAFLNNDVVCLVFTPVVGAALLKQKRNPIPFLIAIAVASNLGASATIVGNAQDMMIAQIANLGFGHYLLWAIVPVGAALTCACALIWSLSRKTWNEPIVEESPPAEPTYPFNQPHTIKGLVILAIVIALFFTAIPKEIVALTAAGIHLASPKFRTSELLGSVDWPILVLFMGLFVVTGAFQSTGYGDHAAQWLAHAGVPLQSPPVLLGVTALLSNLIGNSAAVMLLLKVANIAHPPAAYVLALANSFAGSLIIVGSVANIIVVQQARALGIKITFTQFARLGVPVTLAALACLLAWVALAG